eukprot:16166912-Heterocapsa_arctica.AAC.1
MQSFRNHLRDDPMLQANLLSLSGVHLLCSHCGPEDRCHGDVIIEEYIEATKRHKEPNPRLMRINEMERAMGFRGEKDEGPTYLAGPKQGMGMREPTGRQRDALGNSFNVTVVKRILWNVL